MAVAKDKKEFVSAWNEHISGLSSLCNNFEGDDFLVIYERIAKIKVELKVIVLEASENLVIDRTQKSCH